MFGIQKCEHSYGIYVDSKLLLSVYYAEQNGFNWFRDLSVVRLQENVWAKYEKLNNFVVDLNQ